MFKIIMVLDEVIRPGGFCERNQFIIIGSNKNLIAVRDKNQSSK